MGLAGVDRQAWGLAGYCRASSCKGFFESVGTTGDMFLRVVLAPWGAYPSGASLSERGWRLEHSPHELRLLHILGTPEDT